MKEFDRSKDFVSKVMKSVHAYERQKARNLFFETLLNSRPFRYVLSGSGAIIGIFIPAACI